MYATLSGMRMASPLLALSLGRSPTAAGVLVALFATPQVLLAVAAGRWADRVGTRAVVRWTVPIASLGALLAGVWPVYAGICVAALVLGAAVGATAIALQRHIGHLVHAAADRKRAFSWLSMAPPLANSIGALMTGLIIDRAGYRTGFAALAVMPMAGWLVMRIPRHGRAQRVKEVESAPAWMLLRLAKFRRLLVLNWFSAASIDIHAFIVPVLGHQRGLSASAIGALLGCFAVGTTVIRFVMPMLVAEVSEWKVIAGAMGTAALFFGVYPMATWPLGFAVCAAGLGASVGCVQPMVMSLIHLVTPRHQQGQAIALRHLVVNASTTAMPVLVGAASGLAGISVVFWLMSAVMGIGTRFSFGLQLVGPCRDATRDVDQV
jgi:MFS family permease